MPETKVQKFEFFPGGKNLSVEKERVSPRDFTELEDWDIADDGLPEVAPGYALFLEIIRERTLASMEDDETWSVNAVANTTTGERRFGFQSREHQHVAAGLLDSTFTRDLSFVNTDFAVSSTDELRFFFFFGDVSEISDLKVRFRKDATHYFVVDLSSFIPATDDTAVTIAVPFNSGLITVVGAPALTWADVADINVRSTTSAVDAAGVADISFDDFFAISIAGVSDPITGLGSFEIPGSSKKFLMASSGDSIYSIENGVAVKRATKRSVGQMVHMKSGNDMAVAVNGTDTNLRWNHTDPGFRPLGVPIPALGTPAFVGVGAVDGSGAVGVGTYRAVVTFDMGKHGEGNPSSPTVDIVVGGGDDSIDYSNIPIGPPGTVRRLIHRSKLGSPAGPFFLDVIVADNTATTDTSLLADSSLGNQVSENGQQPPILSFIEMVSDILFGVPRDNPSRVRHSDVTRAANRSIEQWDPLNEMRAAVEDGDILVGLKAKDGFLYSLKRRRTYITDPQVRVMREISSVYGAVSQRSMVDAGQDGFRFWSSEFGPMRVVGQSFSEIGKPKGRDKEGQFPGVEDVSDNIFQLPLPGVDQVLTFDTQDEWKAAGSVFTKTTGDDSPGDVQLLQSGTNFQSEDIAPDGTASSSGFAADLGVASNANDSNSRTGWTFERNATPGVATATITVTFSSAQKLTRMHVSMQSLVSNGFFASASVQYTPAGSGTFVPLLTFNADGGRDAGQALITTRSFPVINADAVRITFTESTVAGDFDWRVNSLELYLQGFENGGYETPDTDLGADPFQFLRLDAEFLSHVPGDMQIFMKSATSSGGLAAAPYVRVFPGAQPDPVSVPPDQHVKLKVILFTNGKRTPRIEKLVLSHNFADTDVLNPIFEANGIWWEGRYWINLVPKDGRTPSKMWKSGRFLDLSSHRDYPTSAWVVHDGLLYSGSALDGKIYVNVRGQDRKRIVTKEGRSIQATLETAHSPMGEQNVEKTVRDFIVSARNEGQQDEILQNRGFEETQLFQPIPIPIPGLRNVSVPQVWEIPSPIAQKFQRTSQLVDRLSSPSDVAFGEVSAKLDARGSDIFPAFVSQGVSLENSERYVIRFTHKDRNGPPPKLKISTADGFVLQDDGTWVASGTPITIPTVGDIFTRTDISFDALSDIENRLPVTISFRFEALDTGGQFFLDAVSLRKNRGSSQFLLIQPILDGVVVGRERILDLRPLKDGVAQNRFRIDQARVKNVAFRIRHLDARGKAKLLSLVVRFSAENVRTLDGSS